VLFVGVGDRAAAGPDAIRRAAMLAAPVIAGFPVAATTLQQAGPAGATGEAGAAAAAFAEGLLLGCYRYDRYKHAPVDPGALRPRPLERVLVVLGADGDGAAGAEVAAGLGRGQLLAGLANWARDLVNAPPCDATPAALAEQARQLAADFGLGFAMLSADGLADGGFGGILGVGRGSVNEPVLVELSYAAGRIPR
jgi:leucyl aminopeptidase